MIVYIIKYGQSFLSNMKQHPLYTKPFCKVFFKPAFNTAPENNLGAGNVVHFRISAPRVGKDYALALIGNVDVLGKWEKPLIMSNKDYPMWTLDVERDSLPDRIEYKYVIVNVKTMTIATWEDRYNRVAYLPDNISFTIEDYDFCYPWAIGKVPVSLCRCFRFVTNSVLALVSFPTLNC